MAAKEYKITLPHGVVVKYKANSAQQAAKRAEKIYAGSSHLSVAGTLITTTSAALVVGVAQSAYVASCALVATQ